MAWSSYVVSSALIKFGQRLARLSMALGRVERDGHVLLESLALFIRYELMVQAPLAEGDDVARAVGRDRFDAFIARVGEALASGQRPIASPVPKSIEGRPGGTRRSEERLVGEEWVSTW